MSKRKSYNKICRSHFKYSMDIHSVPKIESPILVLLIWICKYIHMSFSYTRTPMCVEMLEEPNLGTHTLLIDANIEGFALVESNFTVANLGFKVMCIISSNMYKFGNRCPTQRLWQRDHLKSMVIHCVECDHEKWPPRSYKVK